MVPVSRPEDKAVNKRMSHRKEPSLSTWTRGSPMVSSAARALYEPLSVKVSYITIRIVSFLARDPQGSYVQYCLTQVSYTRRAGDKEVCED